MKYQSFKHIPDVFFSVLLNSFNWFNSIYEKRKEIIRVKLKGEINE